MIAVALCAGCSTLPGFNSEAPASPVAGNDRTTKSAPTPGKPAAPLSAEASSVRPGMNERGEVIDAAKVEMGHGQKVKGLDDWEGEILGKPAPGSKFSRLQIGMKMEKAIELLGPPNDSGTRMSGTMFNPFYFGADKYKRELAYKGMGRLVFGERGGWGRNDGGNLIWIIHSASETGVR